MNKKQIEANFILLLVSAIWGFAFVAQRIGSEQMGPFAFNGIKFGLGAIVLLPVIYFMEKKEKNVQGTNIVKKFNNKTMIIAGISCGTVLFCGASLQQFGMTFTTAGKAGFITALYIILVPLFGIFLKHRVVANAWIGVVLATVGLYLLCMTESLTIGLGDLVILIGAAFWASHILIIHHFNDSVSTLRLAFFQFAFVSLLSLLVSFFIETTTLASVQALTFPLLYCGLLSVATAFTLQIIGQKNAPPTLASIILSMEAVFGAVGGWLILGEKLTSRELAGCIIMLLAIIISQLPNKIKYLGRSLS
jgi:drug/metabolite transporter (DMT)-like permease